MGLEEALVYINMTCKLQQKILRNLSQVSLLGGGRGSNSPLGYFRSGSTSMPA